MTLNFLKSLMIYLLLFFFAFEGTMGSMKIAGISYPRIVEFIVFIFLFKNYLYEISVNKVLFLINKIFGIFLLLLALKLFTVTFMQDNLDMSIFVEAIRVVFLVTIIYLIYYVLIHCKNALQIILIINSVIMFVAFFQSSLTPFTDIAWDLKNTYFHVNTIGYDDNISFRKRVTGFYSTSIPLAYVLTVNMIITVYLYLKNRSNLYIVYFVFLGVIAVLSLTRSVVLAWVVLLLYISFISLAKAKIINKILYIILLFFSFSYATNIYINNMDSLDRVTNTDGASAQGRLPLVITGLYATIKHPFGISEENYKVAKKEMYEIFHNKNILQYESHNGVVNVGLKYTLFGLIIFILFLFYLAKLIKLNLASDMKYFFLVALIAYLANSLFHNNFIVIDDFYGIMLFSIIAYEYKINKEKANNEKN